ncbi:FG-GAP repeat domain-containing protein [Roseovarius sp. C7]|uniref:FG-GAP repeat domain-containing protein n=1 Tax=Roseovarius sp. C7 TaxID=3398643 RepID=UPI0039F7330F
MAARQILSRLLGLLGVCVTTGAAWAGPAAVTEARFTHPTTHYTHGVLGDAVEYAGLEVTDATGQRHQFQFAPNTRVFEDIAPRLWDLTGDGQPEIVVVETDPAQGAQLAIYALGPEGIAKLAATPHIGAPNRWLAPVAAADFDGDEQIEIGYIDRPHLAKRLRLWRYAAGELRPVAELEGLTNHRIGWDHIPGGLRLCDGVAEMITADGDWRRIMAVRMAGGALRARVVGRYDGPESLTRATRCN